MIDLPPATPSDQVIARKLANCGLDRGAISIAWQDELQSTEIVIRRDARASAAQFPCIHDAASAGIVTFEDQALHAAFSDYTVKLYRPRMIADAKAAVTRLNLIDRFPKRSDYAALSDYVRALERHCGLEAGSVLRVSGDTIYFDPPLETDPRLFMQRYEEMLAAITYASAIGDAEGFGFIGNEAVSDASE